MKYFQEIELLHSQEISLHFLWEKLYPQIHLALVEIQDNGKSSVGVSFPEYDAEAFQLGSALRFFAQTSEELENLKIEKWFSRLSDYVRISVIQHVPSTVSGYCYFARQRVKGKSSRARLIRRKAERENISQEDAQKYYENFEDESSRLPFITIKSLSTKSAPYRLLIAKIEGMNVQNGSGFSTYGLSSSSSVPLF